ncbi:SDR family NAD(P)-dependent oxidoreductase [Nocardia sp. CA-119907]|uniref:SDR family NAD(P)-dependent oxidoreductase n=1 Tax=Nocardia sp. CA-119907 TaxID=3239973 RepID=UPI003D99C452
MLLKDKVAMVVGGSESIGRAVATALAEEGASTAICSRPRPEEPEVVADLRGRGLETMWAPGDMTEAASMVSAVERVIERYGKLDIMVVSGAPAGFETGLFEDLDPAQYHIMISSQLTSRLNCLHAALKPMISQGYGKVVFITTDAGRTPTPASSVTGAAAAGVTFFTRSAGRELARRGIRINCIATTLTADTRQYNELKQKGTNPVHTKSYAKAENKFGFRINLPSDIADAALFFAGPQSDQISGAVVSINGGLSFP